MYDSNAAGFALYILHSSVPQYQYTFSCTMQTEVVCRYNAHTLYASLVKCDIFLLSKQTHTSSAAGGFHLKWAD